LPNLSDVVPRTRKNYGVPSRKDLVILALRVLPEKTREVLQTRARKEILERR
jgi:hypothetical protein